MMSFQRGLSCALLIVALCFGTAFAVAGDVTGYVSALGLTPDIGDNPGGGLRCDYAAMDGETVVMTWSDAAGIYEVSGDPAILAPAYVEILGMESWERCRCEVGDLVQWSYGEEDDGALSSIDDYVDRVAEALLGLSAAEALPGAGDARHYVLNNNTMKFHYPDCGSAAKIKDKNREEYDGTREALIARGYSPCGNCKP